MDKPVFLDRGPHANLFQNTPRREGMDVGLWGAGLTAIVEDAAAVDILLHMEEAADGMPPHCTVYVTKMANVCYWSPWTKPE